MPAHKDETTKGVAAKPPLTVAQIDRQMEGLAKTLKGFEIAISKAGGSINSTANGIEGMLYMQVFDEIAELHKQRAKIISPDLKAIEDAIQELQLGKHK